VNESRLQAGFGRYVKGSLAGHRPYLAFVPSPLPPDPPLDLNPLYGAIDLATQALARLDGAARMVPDTAIFLYAYVRKEALLSSQIEGTQSSFSDLLLFESSELPGVPLDDVREVSNYIAAVTHGLARMGEGLPICSRLLKEIHGVLLSSGPGRTKGPGQFRRTQNWIGGSSPGNATFVPPPPDQIDDLMADLERFIHDETVQLPLLVRVALVHEQFETIHPFLDGNGRLGRLLITLMLCETGALLEPLLYLSLFFKTHRPAYYERLMRVRTHGEWRQWIDFFLEGVTETAQQATSATTEILKLFERDRKRIESLGRAAPSALRVHDYLQKKMVLVVPAAQSDLGLSGPTIRKSLRHLSDLKVVREISGKERGRIYVYQDYLSILQEGTEPEPR
jgi:Fic family protein